MGGGVAELLGAVVNVLTGDQVAGRVEGVLKTSFRHTTVHGFKGGGVWLGPIRVVLSNSMGCEGRPFVWSFSVLLHMLLQVGLLCVAFAAILANVSLEMFALLMFGNVLQEGGLVRKTFVTRVTLVWFVSLVTSGMAL